MEKGASGIIIADEDAKTVGTLKYQDSQLLGTLIALLQVTLEFG